MTRMTLTFATISLVAIAGCAKKKNDAPAPAAKVQAAGSAAGSAATPAASAVPTSCPAGLTKSVKFPVCVDTSGCKADESASKVGKERWNCGADGVDGQIEIEQGDYATFDECVTSKQAAAGGKYDDRLQAGDQGEFAGGAGKSFSWTNKSFNIPGAFACLKTSGKPVSLETNVELGKGPIVDRLKRTIVLAQ